MPSASDQLLREAAHAASANPAFLAAVQTVLEKAEAAQADRQSDCRACGACCRFAEWGHRLYASTGELALLQSADPSAQAAPLHCPYQKEALCTARTVRPLGCRIFFCGEEAPDESLYEQAHEQIRTLHESHKIPYFYAEVTTALRILRESE